MKRSGFADLPLHYGRVPGWLAQRMSKLGGAIIEDIAAHYGKSEVLRRISNPLWFQSVGAVLGMDWHSSGITTSVMGALKSAINPMSKDLGIYICGGRGKHSRKTPDELMKVADKTGINGDYLVRCSRLSAKIDNTAIQDGFQIYLHTFIVTDQGEWAVVQQGLNDKSGYARRYHWHSSKVKSFVEEPHAFIYGENRGHILNLVHRDAGEIQAGIIKISKENPDKMMAEISKIIMPSHHEVRGKDVNLKRLGGVLALAYEKQFKDFESLLLLRGMGPRTIQSLALVSEVIHGTPTRFRDPARFSFAHGGKDGHPAPVPVNVYDETIDILKKSINRAKIGYSEKNLAIKGLHRAVEMIEKNYSPCADLEKIIMEERNGSYKHGGRTVFGKAKKPSKNCGEIQLKLF